MPAMATRTVADERKERKRELETTRKELGAAMARYAAAALSGALSVTSGGGEVPARKPLKDGQILCVALDGTGVPARPSETAGRTGKDGGRAGTREAKVGALWVLEPDGEGGLCTADGSVRYFAGVESTADDDEGDSPVARRLLRELAAAGHAPGDVGVCIGDGAAWLRRLFDEWFPDAVSIIDFIAAAGGAHASEYVWAAAGARYGPGTDPARHWATRLCRLLGGRPRRRGAGGAAPGRRRRMRQGGRIHCRAPRPHELRRIPRARPAHRLGARRGGLQDRPSDAA